ncbi:MAG: DUF3108 domain-containing protein [Candidatus Marinimicrobia bacterium]|nr:DUF3108 domain-containing protein [Candidatus Neomarinimicrobiota bacterium]
MKHFIFILFISVIYSRDIPFNVDEKLTYKFQFNYIEVGTATLEIAGQNIIDGSSCFNIQFIAGTSYWGDFIFSIRDTISIWVDQESLATKKIYKNINEGNYHKQTQIFINEDEKYATSNGDTIAIHSSVQDPYSLFYYLRTLPLKLGDIYSFTAIDGRDLTDVKLEVGQKSRVKTPMKWWDTIKVHPYRDGKNLLKNEGEMTIWFSDSEKNPVKIRIELKYGSLILELSNIN